MTVYSYNTLAIKVKKIPGFIIGHDLIDNLNVSLQNLIGENRNDSVLRALTITSTFRLIVFAKMQNPSVLYAKLNLTKCKSDPTMAHSYYKKVFLADGTFDETYTHFEIH